MKQLRQYLSGNMRQYGMVIALTVITLLFGILTDGNIFNAMNVSNLILQNSYLILLSVGMFFCILTGNVDLSVGSVLAFCGSILGVLIVKCGLNPWLSTILVLALGVTIGVIQGVFIAYLNVPPFIVTLAGELMFRGLTLVILAGHSISPFPADFQYIASGFVAEQLKAGPVNILAVICAVCAFAAIIWIQIADRRQRIGYGFAAEPIAFTIIKNVLIFIENMINNGVAGIIISAWDAESLSSAVDTAAANNIKVVCYDMLVSNTKNVSYYVTDNLYDCGRLQGEYIVKALDLDNTAESFNLELFSGDPADSNAPYFFNGAYDALSPYIESGKLNVLSGQIERDVTATADWDGLKAQERMDTILSTYYKGDTRIDAVMCNNDAIALGVLASLKNVGYGTAEKPFPVITGMDCDIANIKAIKSGEISMTVFKDNRIIAKKAAEVMDCVLHDKTPQAGDAFETTFNNGVCDVTAFLIAPEVIDKDNYQAALFDSGYYSEDQLK